MKKLTELFHNISSTTKTLEKVEYIKTFFTTATTPEIALFKMYIDPLFVTYLDKKSLSKLVKYDICKNSEKIINTTDVLMLLTELSERKLTGNNAIETYGSFISNLDDDIVNTINIITTKASTGISDKLVNRAYNELYGTDFIELFQCQLANTYNPEKKSSEKCFYASPKLDGLRCVYRNGQLWTRNLKPVIGFDHISKELETLIENTGIDIVDGELYSHELEFSEIQGFVMRSKNINEDDKKKIFYNVFAVVGDSIKNTHEMVESIQDLQPGVYVKLVEQELIQNNFEDIKTKALKYVSEGYEGIMLRSVNTPYDYKRSNALLKYKFFLEDDFVITGFFEGQGKLENSLGGFEIESVNGKIKSRVGSGFSEEQRKEFYLNIHKYVGQFVEVKYQGITDDGTSLRFPVFLKLKEDR